MNKKYSRWLPTELAEKRSLNMAGSRPTRNNRRGSILGGSHGPFIQALFRSAVGRPATPDEVLSISAIIGGAERADAVREVLYSQEAMARTIQRIYSDLLGRSATLIEEQPAVAAIRSGKPLDRWMASLIESVEYIRRAATHIGGSCPHASFVRILYSDLLRREPSPADLQSGVTKSANAGRTTLVISILRSVEYRSAIVRALYDELLHRPTSPEEVRPWTSWGNSAVDLLKIRLQLLASDEFYERWK
jgi:hypothetical protein